MKIFRAFLNLFRKKPAQAAKAATIVDENGATFRLVRPESSRRDKTGLVITDNALYVRDDQPGKLYMLGLTVPGTKPRFIALK